MDKKDIAHHLRYETKRTDLPPDVIQTMGEAYAEIVRLEKRILDFQEGFEGGCYLCEPVGEVNRTIRNERDEARREVMDWIANRCSPSELKEEYEERGWNYLLEKNNG